MQFSTSYTDYERLLKTIHDLNASDLLDSPEAELTRDQMDVAWRGLNETERTMLRGLSADLYSLTGEEIVADSAFINEAALMEAAKQQYENEDWVSLLQTLRALSNKFPPAVVAYMRGRCWREIGRPEPALWFFELAHRLDPSQPNYELLALDARFRSSDRLSAVEKAKAILDDDTARPHAVFGAAEIVSEVASRASKDDARELYKRVTSSLQAALKRVESDATLSIVPSLKLAAHLNLAIALERQGDVEAAKRAFDQAVAAFPGRDEIIIARAMFLLGQQPELAMQDLRELVQRNTSSVYPYFFLAHHALVNERFEQCIELSERVSRMASDHLMRAHALEWMAISHHELGGPMDATLELFRQAIYLAPFSKDIIENYDVAARLREQARVPLKEFVLQRPIEPREVTFDIQARLTA